MDAFHILVIVLSTLLAIFLVLSIVTVIIVLRLVRTLHDIALKGGEIVERAEEIGQTLARNAGAVGMVRMLLKFIATANKVKKGRR